MARQLLLYNDEHNKGTAMKKLVLILIAAMMVFAISANTVCWAAATSPGTGTYNPNDTDPPTIPPPPPK
jgi:hypothetical protein